MSEREYPYEVPDDADVDEDVLVEQDNEYIADRWADAEDYEWET